MVVRPIDATCLRKLMGEASESNGHGDTISRRTNRQLVWHQPGAFWTTNQPPVPPAIVDLIQSVTAAILPSPVSSA